MRKLFYMLMALMPFGLLSCSDSNDLPDVDVSVSMDNVVYNNGYVYIVQGDTLKINDVAVKGNGSTAGLNGVNYMFDYRPVGYRIVKPYGINLLTKDVPAGKHLLSMNFEILQVDKSITMAGLEYDVVIVNDSTELPTGTVPGPINLDYTLSPSGK